MDCKSTRLPYRQTGAFPKIALDYIDQAAELKPFFAHPPSLPGIRKAIEARKKYPGDRNTLVKELKKQYGSVETSDRVKKNIESLLSADTFTVTTAHQNNLFTGPLYFIYKIVHVIKLADHLNASLKGNHFVPVFYIGTEDADLEELNHTWVGGEKLVWETKQSGAVGRMRIDKALVRLIERMEGQLAVLPKGNEIIGLLKQHYKEGTTMAAATFGFVNTLFAEYGLVIVLPESGAFKKQMIPVFEDDLLHQSASGIVAKSTANLVAAGYKIQAQPREINVFYLRDDSRNRIEFSSARSKYSVLNTSYGFTKQELLRELSDFPDRFSPNVILRGLYQETILPNIAFIGGPGETAYWLQLKDLFGHYKVPFPVLVLRNSFLVVEKKWQERIGKLGFRIEDLFLPGEELLNRLVARESSKNTKLNGSLDEMSRLYELFKKQAAAIDRSLEKHVESLRSKTVHRLQELEKKMLRAEKRKYADQRRQIMSLKEQLFPGNGLQERHDNLSYYYAKWGRSFLGTLYEHSLTLEQEFVLLEETGGTGQ